MQAIKRSTYIFTRLFMVSLLALTMAITVSYAEDDIETETYEDPETGITFDYPAEWTDLNDFEEDNGYGFNIFSPDNEGAISVLIAESGTGKDYYDDTLENLTLLEDRYDADYAGITFEVAFVQVPDLGKGYVLFTEMSDFDLILGIVANDGLHDTYLAIITDSLVLPDVASDTSEKDEETPSDIETSTYEDDENGIRFDYPAEWTEIDEYGDDISDSIDIILPDESAGVTVIVAESGEGETIVDEIGENITIEDDTTTAEYAGVTFTVFEIEVPDFEDEDGDSRFGYLLFTEALSYDLLIGIITTDGMEDDYLEIITESLVLPEAEQADDNDDSKEETDSSETDVDDGLIFAEEFDSADVSDNVVLSFDASAEEVALEDAILVDEDGTSYIQLQADPPDVLPYLSLLDSVPDTYELHMRLRLAESSFTAMEIDVAFSDDLDEYVTIAFNRQDVRIKEVIFDTSEMSLAIESFETPRDTWIDVRILVADSEITVFVDDEEVVQTENASYIGNNFVGVFVSNGIVDIDYIRVYA